MVDNSQPEELEIAEKLIRENEYEEALSTIKNFENKAGISNEDKLSALILEGKIYFYIENWQEAVRVGELTYHLSRKLGKLPEIIESLIVKALIMHIGKPDSTLELIHEAEMWVDRLAKETDSKLLQERAVLLLAKSWAYVYKGDTIMALKLALKGISVRNNLDEKIRSNKSIFMNVDPDLLLCYIYQIRGELDYALDYAIKSLEFQKKNNNAINTASSLRALGIIYSYKGDFDSSIKYCNQGLSIRSISNFSKYNTFLVLGRNYKIRGELNQALKYFEKADTISKVMDLKTPFLAVSLLNVGTIYLMKGDYDKAVEFVERALLNSERFKIARYTATSLFWLVSIYLEKKMPEEAQLYLTKLKEFADGTENKWNSQAYQTAKALVLKTSRRTRNRAEAEILLKQIAEEEITDFDIYILSLVSLCEFLLEELEISNEPEVLEEINPVIARLLEIAENQHSYSILAETNLLQ